MAARLVNLGGTYVAPDCVVLVEQSTTQGKGVKVWLDTQSQHVYVTIPNLTVTEVVNALEQDLSHALPELSGEAIQRRREDMGLTQEELANAMNRVDDHDWSRSVVSRVENGHRPLTYPEAQTLHRIMGSLT